MALRLDKRPLFSCSSCSSMFVIWTVTALLNADVSMGMQLTSSGPQTVQMAQGEKVRLGCTYTPGPSDTGALDVEWSLVSPDTTQKDQLLLSYAGGSTYRHGAPDLTEGLAFAAGDPSLGDASLAIASLAPGHTATYQCKVKKSPGVDMRKVSLVVLVKPSAPKCWVEGGGQVGQAVSVHCKASQGSSPLSYVWKRERGPPIPAAASQDPLTGELQISNHSESYVGVYLCEVTNTVGTDRCRLQLKVNTPPNKAGVIVGTVVGSLLLLVILLILIGVVIWKYDRRRPRHDKEEANEIREDVPAPESRPASRMTSRGGSLHPGVSYSQVGGSFSQGGGAAYSPSQLGALQAHGHPDAAGPREAPPSSSSTGYTPVKYDSRQGYAV